MAVVGLFGRGAHITAGQEAECQRLEENATDAESNGWCRSSNITLRGSSPGLYLLLPARPHFLKASHRVPPAGAQHAECEAVTGIPNSNLTVQPTASGIGDLSGSVVAVPADSMMGPVREATSGLQLEARWRRLDWN